MLCWFLLYNMNQLHVYPPLLEPPFLHTPHPRPLGHHRAPSSAPWSMQLPPSSFLLYAWYCMCVNATLSIHPTLFFPNCVHKCSLHLHLYYLLFRQSVSIFFDYPSVIVFFSFKRMGSTFHSISCLDFFFFHFTLALETIIYRYS